MDQLSLSCRPTEILFVNPHAVKGDCHSSGQGDLRTSGTLSMAIFIAQAFMLDRRVVGRRMTFAASNKAVRVSLSPTLVMRPTLSTSPDWYLRGVRPRYAPTDLDRRKRLGVIDRCPVGERGDGSYARDGHEATADGIHSNRSQDEPVQIRQVLAQTPVHLQERFKDTQQQPIRSDQLSNACLETNARDGANL